jgi:hypothetical protein
MAGLYQRFTDWLQRSPVAIGVSVFASILVVGTVLEEFDRIKSLLNGLIFAGLKVDWDHRTTSLSDWLALLLMGVVALIILLSIFLIRALVVSLRPTDALRRRNKVAIKTLRKMMAAASQIRNQLFPPAALPVKRLRLCEGTYLIHKNFDMEVKTRYEVLASDKHVHFVQCDIGVENEADEAEFLDYIGFRVKDGKNQFIPYLPSRDDPRYKGVMIYFLPEIDPAETKPRTLMVTYLWPGGFKRLSVSGQEEFIWDLRSKDNIPSATYQFFLENGTGKVLHCQVTGSTQGTQNLEDGKIHPDKGWDGWQYTIENAPPGEYRLMIRLREP